jgi:DNA polymerase III epsilon subunit-like protein
MTVDQTLDQIRTLLAEEREAGRINGLEAIKTTKARRAIINEQWSAIQAQLAPIQQQIKFLPPMPPDSEIEWAQNILENQSLSFLEIDTTGVGQDSEIIRFTLSNQTGDPILADFFIKPQNAELGQEAREANGIEDYELRAAPSLPERWAHMRSATQGRYILSFNQEWDIKQLQLAAQRYNLPPITIIGECLQRRCTQYYHREYYLTLAGLCERIGHPLPNNRAETRIKGQLSILWAMSAGIVDTRPPEPPRKETSTGNDDLFETDDALSGLDDHPF